MAYFLSMDALDTAPKYPLVWVRPDSNVQRVGAMLASSILESERVDVRGIGAGAVNQMLKGVINARQTVASQGLDLVCRPGVQVVSGREGQEVRAIVLRCFLLSGG